MLKNTLKGLSSWDKYEEITVMTEQHKVYYSGKMEKFIHPEAWALLTQKKLMNAEVVARDSIGSKLFVWVKYSEA